MRLKVLQGHIDSKRIDADLRWLGAARTQIFDR
jgi:hypothetical protein